MATIINNLTARLLTSLLPFHHPLRRTLRAEGYEVPALPASLRYDLSEQNDPGQNS